MVSHDIANLSNWLETYLDSGVTLTPHMVGNLLSALDDAETKAVALEQAPCVLAVHRTVVHHRPRSLWRRIRSWIGGAS